MILSAEKLTVERVDPVGGYSPAATHLVFRITNESGRSTAVEIAKKDIDATAPIVATHERERQGRNRESLTDADAWKLAAERLALIVGAAQLADEAIPRRTRRPIR